jgi:hypothetical protein
MMLLLPKFVAGFSGDYVNAFGYASSLRPRHCWACRCCCWWDGIQGQIGLSA